MKEPRKPRKPREPSKPTPVTIINKRFYVDDNTLAINGIDDYLKDLVTKQLSESWIIVDENKRNYTVLWDTLALDFLVETIYDEIVYVTVDIEYKNVDYEKDLRAYERKLKNYKEKLDKYKANLKVYNEEKKKYVQWVDDKEFERIEAQYKSKLKNRKAV